jgi:hypothetical protein
MGYVFLEQFKAMTQVVDGNMLLHKSRPVASLHILTFGTRSYALMADRQFFVAFDLTNVRIVTI